MRRNVLSILAGIGISCVGLSAMAAENDQHTIGVLTYSSTADEPMAFRDYLTGYIEMCFNVKFVYSSDITSQEEEIAFIKAAADYGVEGIMSFNSFDLEQEVSLCEEEGIYYMMASGSVSEESFASVSDNPYFLGVVGPGTKEEYEIGVMMADQFLENEEGTEFFILSGGAGLGNEMHLRRTIGILDEIQEKCGVSFEKSSEELALSAEPTHVEAGDVKVCITPGYVEYDTFYETACEEYEKDHYKNVLSVLPGSRMKDTLKGAHVGIVDCFCENNLLFMENGELCFVAGKYGSLIGPSFAAMYNAVTGHTDMMREDGKAFQISQGFWISNEKEDYLKKYSLASGLELTAYNYEDIQSVCVENNAEATLEDIKELAAAYSYEEVCARRGLQ